MPKEWLIIYRESLKKFKSLKFMSLKGIVNKLTWNVKLVILKVIKKPTSKFTYRLLKLLKL